MTSTEITQLRHRSARKTAQPGKLSFSDVQAASIRIGSPALHARGATPGDLSGGSEGAVAPPAQLGVLRRYALTAFGPIAIAGTHFLTSLLFLHALSAADFGLFSFVLVVVPLSMSMSSALLGAPIAVALNKAATVAPDEMGTYYKASLAYAVLATAGVFLFLLASRATALVAFILAFYGGAMVLRWFARSLTYARHKPLPAAISDAIYSGLLLALLVTLLIIHRLSMESAAIALFVSASLSIGAFGRDFLRRQFRPGRPGSLAAYRPIWHDLARWSLAGVVLSEMTGNAHAYFVTFVAGPRVFALLALGALAMRPASLVLSALPDMERPIMARKIACGDAAGAFRTVNEFRTAAGAILLATIVLAAALLTFFPHLLIKPGYDATKVYEVVALWAAISAVRALRTPEAVFLQAAREFASLARAGARSSVVSLIATPILFFAAGPVASLGGVLAGDMMMTANIFFLTRHWRKAHG